jgi:hypothetical protein
MDDMSASTRTIQRPMGNGSILAPVLMAVAVLFAVVAITWGATNLVATKTTLAPVQAPIVLDKGSRDELQKSAPLSVGGYHGPRIGGARTNPDWLKEDSAFTVGGSTQVSNGGHGGFRAQ